MANTSWRIPRSRGAMSGLLLVLLGAWGALAAVIGPVFGYAFGPDLAWTMTTGRWILQVLPGAAVVVGGLFVLAAGDRVSGLLGGALAAAAGAWFVVGQVFSGLWSTAGDLQGAPLGTQAHAVVEQIGIFSGLGVAVVFVAALAIGRFTAPGARDGQAVEEEREARLRRHRAHRTAATVPGPGPTGLPGPSDPRD